jgi:hypothetical protein
MDAGLNRGQGSVLCLGRAGIVHVGQIGPGHFFAVFHVHLYSDLDSIRDFRTSSVGFNFNYLPEFYASATRYGGFRDLY